MTTPDTSEHRPEAAPAGRMAFADWAAGFCVGLLLGSAALAGMLNAHEPAALFRAFLLTVFGGFIVLAPAVLLIGAIVTRVIERQQFRFGGSAFLVLLAAVLCATAVGVIIDWFTSPAFTSLLVLVPAAVWCSVIAIIIQPLLRRDRRVAVVVISVTAVLAAAGGVIAFMPL